VAEALLRSALRELLVGFPVYRTYGNLCGLPAEGRQVLSSVLANVPGDASSTAIDELAFLVRILTGDVSEASASQAVTFRSRFQQLTGPLMAKSVEDTLFFRQHMALALNEVGASPLTRRFSLSRFHEEMQLRLERQPDGLSSTSTHDTKRGEDGRARLYSISEAPGVWAEAVSRWRDMNGSFVEMLDDGAAPEPEVEWMLYQALAGAWPANLHTDHAKDLSALETRFVQYVEKALREAKLRTNWVAHNDAYERAVIRYARRLVSRDNPLFLIDFIDRLQSFARAGRTNSISQTVIKLMAPGVPDIYQGSEGLDFSLVDPDNRREPDFRMLQTLLAMDPPGFNDDEDWSSGRLKQHIIARLLRLRGDMPGLFSRGSYIPLLAQGKRSDGLIAFARANATDAVIVLVARLSLSSGNTPLSSHCQGVTVGLPDILVDRPFFEVFAGRRVELDRDFDVGSAAFGRCFAVYRST
jgi:(1->4)-alpha-D-glucan 1-alpha-D-glucosylmutase